MCSWYYDPDMRTFLGIATCLLLFLLPLRASAHAMPVTYVPASGGVTDTLPTDLTITFSERIDIAASSLHVKGPTGAEVAEGKPVPVSGDPKTMSVPVHPGGDGTYVVSWSVVSADDGHFTKGSYAIGIGKGITVAETSATSEVVKIATVPEALAMTVELAGNGIIWAALLLFAFAVRPLLRDGRFTKDASIIRKGYELFLVFGTLLALVGGALQLYIKTLDLASLQGIARTPAFVSYLQTAAGEATVGRVVVVLVVIVFFATVRKWITRSERMTPYEVVLMVAMLVFAFLRAKISHATANPFHPNFSVFMNVIHLVEKDLLFGIGLVLVCIALIPRLRAFLDALIPKAFVMLVIDLAFVSVTATYIVWLHLKSFANLFTTEWGSAFLVLLLYAVLWVGVHSYHTFARIYAPKFFSRMLPATLAAELAFAVLLIYASSVVIITSPPLPLAHGTVFEVRDQGATITLVREGTEDSAIHLEVRGAPNSPEPFLTIRDTSTDGADIAIPLRKRFDGGYAFPAVLMGGMGPYEVSVTAPQTGAYDAHATFTVTQKDLALSIDPGKHRSFDLFTTVMLGIAFAALIFAGCLYVLSTRPQYPASLPTKMVPAYFLVLPTFLVCAYVGVGAAQALAAHGLLNPFKYACEDDGNMWHAMLPTREGVPIAQVPQEGCMWGMGDFPYLFVDFREYTYARTLPPVTVTLSPDTHITAGVPTRLTVRLTDPDGNPAPLYRDMEKLLHMVIISKDERTFAHIHPDDARPLTPEEIKNSTFTFEYTFPRAGTYIIASDYANGITLGSHQFVVDVAGGAPQSSEVASYPSHGTFGGYDVALSYGIPVAGQVTTLIYDFAKDGKPVTTLAPYLSAAMHVAVVKNDFSSFVHTHGELHPPGVPYPPVRIKNGQVVHTMASMYTPPQFGPRVEAHLVFPSPGRYTVWGQFKVGEEVIPTAFTVDVE